MIGFKLFQFKKVTHLVIIKKIFIYFLHCKSVLYDSFKKTIRQKNNPPNTTVHRATLDYNFLVHIDVDLASHLLSIFTIQTCTHMLSFHKQIS